MDTKNSGEGGKIQADAEILGIRCLMPKTLAAHLGLKENTLATWRVQKKGPTFFKVGNNIFYPINEACKWLAEIRGHRR